MSYDQLILLQNTAKVFFWLCIAAGSISFILGMYKPTWAGVSKRRWVVLRSIGILALGFVVVAGTIFYTHSQPNGPHAFNTYLESYAAKKCVERNDLTPCEDIVKKCAGMPGTIYPACEILRGGDGGIKVDMTP